MTSLIGFKNPEPWVSSDHDNHFYSQATEHRFNLVLHAKHDVQDYLHDRSRFALAADRPSKPMKLMQLSVRTKSAYSLLPAKLWRNG